MGAAPSTTDPLAGQVTGTTALVYWTTSESMTSEVHYGLDSLYGSVAGTGGSARLDHSITLTGLSPSTLYHFRVKNHSSAGETLYSFDRAFQTPEIGVTAPIHGQYGFASSAQGWVRQEYMDSRAVAAVSQTAGTFQGRSGFLDLTLDLRGGHPNYSKGEAFVEFKNQSPVGVPMGFIDIDLRPLSAWVYASTGAVGNVSQPNGVQLFAIDTSGRSEYGPFTVISQEAWFQVTYTPLGGGNAFSTPGFDSTKIALIGIKVGVGDSSVAVYQGPLYVDSVEF
ncbi:MAG: fibronectin type III domain-containing protein [Elusimicrobia bacterium]|nr:fibronectin type III domain-containing protein [Elusimicrobiota bacterium]